jgi:hypothetical protein
MTLEICHTLLCTLQVGETKLIGILLYPVPNLAIFRFYSGYGPQSPDSAGPSTWLRRYPVGTAPQVTTRLFEWPILTPPV